MEDSSACLILSKLSFSASAWSILFLISCSCFASSSAILLCRLSHLVSNCLRDSRLDSRLFSHFSSVKQTFLCSVSTSLSSRSFSLFSSARQSNLSFASASLSLNALAMFSRAFAWSTFMASRVSPRLSC